MSLSYIRCILRQFLHPWEHYGLNSNYFKPTQPPTLINSRTCTDGERGPEMDSWLNIVCFRQGGMGYKLETDVQSEPKSIIKTFISKQDEAPGVDV